MLRDTFSMTVGLIIVIILLGIVGAMDAEDAEKQEELYCEMVAAGRWPDYQRNAKEICRGKAPPRPNWSYCAIAANRQVPGFSVHRAARANFCAEAIRARGEKGQS